MAEAVDASPAIAENPNLMAIAIEFRLKPLIQNNPSAQGRRSEGESKAYKQLKQDCNALITEHPDQVCFTCDPEKVTRAANMVFRQFNVEETGRNIAQ